MRSSLRAAGAALVSTVALAAPSAFAAPPVEAFGSLPAISNAHLSPDGKYFSAIEPVNGRPTVVVFQLDAPAGTKPIIFGDPGSFALDSRWVNNDRLICIVHGNVTENTNEGLSIHDWQRAISVSISGKDTVVLLKKSSVFAYNRGGANIIGLNTENPNIVYMGAAQWTDTTARTDTRLDTDAAIYNLYSVNVETGDVDLVEHGTKYTNKWIMDGHGHVVARVDESDETGTMKDTLFIYNGSESHAVGTFDASTGVEINPAALTQDGASLAISRYGDRNTWGMDAFPLSGTTFGATLFSNPGSDISDVQTDDWTGRVIGVGYEIDKMEHHYFDANLAHQLGRLQAALPGQSVEIVSSDAKADRLLVYAEDPHNPPSFYAFTPATGVLEFLATGYPQLQASDLGDEKPYPYKARDGLDIPAYLTLPPGKQPHNLPVVMLPHGGPGDRDAVRFDWLAQFMASRGYAVLQPNFRGSDGYGAQFRDAGDGQWGRKMQDDITDGVKKLIADGIADPKRVCIVGMSYGGYAALAGATFTPDLYACAVSYAGVSDVANIIGHVAQEAGMKSSDVGYLEARIGKLSDEKAMEAVSPALHADQVKAPILLLHSVNDVTVPIGQSILEQTALEKAGKKVQFITLDGDDHYIELAATRIRVLKEIDAFLAANIGN